jgi:hypothetical protein
MAESAELPQTLSKFEYEKLIEEEEINVQELPKPIKQKINVLSMQKAKYIQKPTANKLESIKVEDAHIADMIQSWLEKDLPDPIEEPIVTPAANEPPPPPAKTEAELAKEKAEAEAAEKAEAELKAKQAVEAKFKETIAKDGSITAAELKQILGRRDLNDSEEFAGIKLKRGMSFLKTATYYTA